MEAVPEPDVDGWLIEVPNFGQPDVNSIDKATLAAVMSRTLAGSWQESQDVVTAFTNYI
jgi:hypothetical protein